MPFQFYCPQGHLLQGDESQQGQQGKCPICGSMFMFPMMGGQPASPAAPGGAPFGPAAYGQGGYPGAPGGFPGQAPGGGPGGFGPAPDRFAGLEPAAQQGFAPPEPEAPPEPRTFRIICPKGHEVQTPEDMLGTQALCPYCNTQMELRYEDSVEFKKQKEFEQKVQDDKTGRFWMSMAIWASVLVGLAFVAMIVYLVL